MTYDTKAIYKKPFSWFSHNGIRVFMFLALLFLTVLPSLSLQATSLTYDQATGKLSGFEVKRDDTPGTVDSYGVIGEFWSEPGYVGRLLYVGAPTKFTFSNVGSTATGGGNMFYFTHADRNDRWREFFLVIRAKGLIRGGTSQDDFSGVNSEIQVNTGTYDLPKGAGDEPAISGQTGYDESGNSGEYDGSNQFKYRYRYSHIWIDVTIIHTSNKRWGSNNTHQGYYISNLQVATANGESLILNLQGKNDPQSSQTAPFTYFFEIDKSSTEIIPYSVIKNYNDKTNALEIASIAYSGEAQKAEITISSDAGGINTDFSFKNTTGQSFTHKLAFKSTLPEANPIEITGNNRSFKSSNQTKWSPIGDSTNGQRLEGKILLYVPSGTTPPASGTYKSTIYVLVEPTT